MALVVITGGARSGKSAAAQRLAESRQAAGDRVVTVVFADGDSDQEMAARIAHHRALRPPEFAVIEAGDATTWRGEIPTDALLVIDCLGTLAARLMDELPVALDDDPAGFEAAFDAALNETISWVVCRAGDTIVVTNEVGSGVVPAYASGRVFRDCLGRAGVTLVRVADAAYLAVAGRLIDLTAAPCELSWPSE
ncbi:MAG: bifunctional adenosylcobinamide kinase/adenosylcobinamide-phosphate guanylyltransferase [Clostridiales bacterium]|nr:bifunctional adenosylcobinamide kinase/adenosylcobinamide-phosphate guanylyltransferase [Clostridiales bacterium]